jgi:hypothetical protein
MYHISINIAMKALEFGFWNLVLGSFHSPLPKP